ncbi:hypothetical protein [Methanoregula sp.]|uniref:hypothetical protein n=1 Tax=Methanoregula sp. TaxID=2052170 RepID=UPI003C78D6F2
MTIVLLQKLSPLLSFQTQQIPLKNIPVHIPARSNAINNDPAVFSAAKNPSSPPTRLNDTI